jgi:2-aminoadipate transaminase
MAAALSKIRDIDLEYEIPKGGMSFWVRLPDDMNPSALLECADKLGVGFIPGRLFYPDGEYGGNHIRLSYAQTPKDRIAEGVKLLHDSMRSAARKQKKALGSCKETKRGKAPGSDKATNSKVE